MNLKKACQQNKFKSFFLIFVAIVQIVNCGHIYSWDISSSYNFDGYLQSLSFIFKLESGLGPLDTIQIQLPFSIGAYNNIQYTILQEQNNVVLASKLNPVSTSSATTYYLKCGVTIIQNVWHKIIMYVDSTLLTIASHINPQLYPNPIAMVTQSTDAANPIIYDYSYDFGQINVASIPTASLIGMQVTIASANSGQNYPGIPYNIYIDFTPQINYNNATKWTILIDQPSLDFQFQGTCFSVAKLDAPTMNQVNSNCEILSDLQTLVFMHYETINTTNTFRIKTRIQNPNYVALRDLKVYVNTLNDQRTLSNGLAQLAGGVAGNVLKTNLLQFVTNSQTYKFLWGLASNEAISIIPFNYIFISQAAGVTGPLNSIQISFKIQDASPLISKLKLYMTIGATGILEGSIVHNLPNYERKKVTCYYVFPQIICENVGAFLQLSQSYFLAFKAYYDNNVATVTCNINYPCIENFGQVNIDAIINQNTVQQLYNVLVGSSLQVVYNNEFLDIGAGGWHDRASQGLGTTQIVSQSEDTNQILVSTPLAIQKFFQRSDSSVGIIPDSSIPQQLLFFLKVSEVQYCGTACGTSNVIRMNILVNSNMIKFRNGYLNKGIDFAAYDSASSAWSVKTFPCYNTLAPTTGYCRWYNQNDADSSQLSMQQQNINAYISGSQYFISTFDCGQDSNLNSFTNCDMFKGNAGSDGYKGVFALRNIQFSSNFQSQIYPDDKLLDFIITFSVGTSPITSYALASQQLINSYAITGVKLQNLKISYVNYYQQAITNNFNDGKRIPTMLRLGGSVMTSEHLGATQIHIFFDETMDSSNFFTNNINDKTDFSIGCSTSLCEYFPNKNVVSSRDTWMNSRRISISSIPNIENEFNILIPINQASVSALFPTNVIVAFTKQMYTSLGVSNQLQILAAYRAFGPVIQGSVMNPIPNVNGISTSANTVLFLSSLNSWMENSGDLFQPQIQTTNLGSNNLLSNEIRLSGSTINTITYPLGSKYGAGITISSLQFDIFQVSTINWQGANLQVQQCSKLNYVFNDLTSSFENKKTNYVVFCPIDQSTFSFGTGVIQIDKLINPSYFSYKFPLGAVLSYALSKQTGELVAYQKESQILPITVNTPSCISLNTLTMLRPGGTSLSARQKLQFQVQAGAIIDLDPSGLYGFIQIIIQISTSLASTAIQDIPSSCFVDSPLNVFVSNQCSYSAQQYTFTAAQKYTIQKSDLIKFSLYVKTDATLLTPVAYTATILLPVQNSGGQPQIFGTVFDVNSLNYATCSGTILVSSIQYGSQMSLTNLVFEQLNGGISSPFSFIFQFISDREFFYSSSKVKIDFGFMGSQQLQCVIYEGNQISFKWKSIDFVSTSNFGILIPKDEFQNPHSFIFNVKCQNGLIPTATGTDISASWTDLTTSEDIIQQSSTTFSFSSNNFDLTSKTLDTILVSTEKIFNSVGMEAFYTFTLQSSYALTFNSRIYVYFWNKILPKINREGSLECNIGLTSTTTVLTVCELISERKLSIWMNNQLTPGQTFVLQIFHVAQPTLASFISTSIVEIAIDTDSYLNNGIDEITRSLVDPSPLAPAYQQITILNIFLSQNFIRLNHDIYIDLILPSNAVLQDANLFIDFPMSYSININIRDMLVCNVLRSNINYTKACAFISKKRLQLTLNVDAGNSGAPQQYRIVLTGLISPSFVPLFQQNQIKLLIFLTSADKSQVTHIGSDYETNSYGFQQNTSKIDLKWDFNMFQQNNFGTLSEQFVSKNNADIYIGYYKTVCYLRPVQFTYSVGFNFSLIGSNINYLSFRPSSNSFFVSQGSLESRFNLAAVSGTPAGIYTFIANKTAGDPNQIYSQLPPMTLTIRGEKCSTIQASDNTYYLPIGGTTLPIILEFQQCFPVSEMNLTVGFSVNALNNLQINSLQSKTYFLSLTTNDSRLFMVIQQIQPILPLDLNVVMSFSLTGNDSANYFNPQPVNIIIKSNTSNSFKLKPYAKNPNNVVLLQNSASMSFFCDQPAFIYWVIGLSPSLSDVTLTTITNKIQTNQGLLRNFTEENDIQLRVYGFESMTISALLPMKFINLKQDSDYQLKYYCVNQLNLQSDASQVSWHQPNNGALLLKITFFFKSYMSYTQINDTACVLSSLLQVAQSRVFTEIGTTCNQPPLTSVIKISDNFTKNSFNGFLFYQFYIQPAYTAVQDYTNLLSREKVNKLNFINQYLALQQNPSLYPILTQVMMDDISEINTPVLVSQSLVSTQSTIIFKGMISNQNGYIIAGLKLGPKVSTRPTLQNLRMGLDGASQPLVYQFMSYTAINQQVQFQFRNLKIGQIYTFYACGTTDNPSQLALTGNILEIQVATQQEDVLAQLGHLIKFYLVNIILIVIIFIF